MKSTKVGKRNENIRDYNEKVIAYYLSRFDYKYLFSEKSEPEALQVIANRLGITFSQVRNKIDQFDIYISEYRNRIVNVNNKKYTDYTNINRDTEAILCKFKNKSEEDVRVEVMSIFKNIELNNQISNNI